MRSDLHLSAQIPSGTTFGSAVVPTDTTAFLSVRVGLPVVLRLHFDSPAEARELAAALITGATELEYRQEEAVPA